jgi:hypothetical protein
MFDAPLEVPVTIRNPNEPIGRHVLTAVERNGHHGFGSFFQFGLPIAQRRGGQ